MTRWFLHAALAEPQIVAALAGAAGDVDAPRAELSGHVARVPPGALADVPRLRPEGDAETPSPAHGAREGAMPVTCDGRIVELSDAETRILRLLAAGLRLGDEGSVQPEGRATARAFLAPGCSDGQPWDARLWGRQGWPDLLAGAVSEIRQLGRRLTPATMPRRLPMMLSRAAARWLARAGVPASIRSATPASQVVEVACRTPHAGFFLTQSCDLRHPRFAGGLGARVRREVFVATDAALVLPYDPVRDRVLLVEQFRIGPYRRGDPRPFVLEPVAGRVDAGETPEQAARRECAEEAGLDLHRLRAISSHYCSPGCSTEYFHLFLGLCDLPDTGHGHGGLAAEHEDIRTHVLGFAEAMQLLETGEADNGPLVLSLLWLVRERDFLSRAHGA